MDERKTGIDRNQIRTEALTEADSVQFYLEEMQRMNNQLVDAQRELTRALSVAEQAKKEKEQFFSAMSHDIRIPLNAIRGMTSLALDDIDNRESVRESLQVIQNSSEYVISIITDILDLGQMESGSSPLEEVSFCLQDELETIRIMMSSFFEGKHQTLVCAVPETPFYLYGSWKHVRRIITNLLSNASKYTQDGGQIILTASVETEDKGVMWTTISVQDNGMGMTEGQRKKLFTPYFRTDRAEVKRIMGTGLGLTIVKRFTELCGGSVAVISQENRGSTFTVKLPFTKGIRQTVGLEDLCSNKFQGRELCCLLCEDNRTNAKIVQKLLERYGIQTDFAENGQVGTELFQKNPNKYAGVLMDLHMPVMGGLEATGIIRHMDADLPIIALTGDRDAAVLRQMQKLGITEVLEKPLDPKKFYETIFRCIG